MEKKDKKKKILKVSGLVALFLLIFGLSYALFTVTLNGTKKVKISTGRLELQLLDANNNTIYVTGQNSESSYAINLENQVPVDDEAGLGTEGFTFKLKNTGNVKAKYTIYLDNVALEEGESRIDDEYIRYSLTKNGSEDSAQALTSRELDKGTIEANNTTNEYTLKIWIAENATNEAMDKVFNATLRVEGMQYVPAESSYGIKIAETQLSETVTATYYQPEESAGYNSNTVKRMSNVQKIDNKELYEATYKGGTLVISGTGAMPDAEENEASDAILFLFDAPSSEDLYDNNYDKYFEYDEELGEDILILKYAPKRIIVEEGITKIGNGSFEDIYSIENVQFPNTLVEIGDSSFRHCKIQQIEFPDSLKSIGTYVFYENPLTNVILNNGLEEIKEYAFSDTNITTITIPSSVKKIEQAAFSTANKFLIESEDVEFVQGFHGAVFVYGTLYCKTQACYDNLTAQNLNGHGTYGAHTEVPVVLDPTKFE